MKKATLKLGIRRETLRVLAALDLVHAAAGGPAAQLMDTEGPNHTCVAQLVAIGNAGTKA